MSQQDTSVRLRGRLMKGYRGILLRKMLYMTALQAIKRANSAFHSYCQALVTRGKSNMYVIGAIMHKIIRSAFGVLKHDTPFVKNFAKPEN